MDISETTLEYAINTLTLYKKQYILRKPGYIEKLFDIYSFLARQKEKNRFSTKSDIQKSLEEKKYTVSDRQFHRDLEAIQRILNVSIEYVRPYGYKIIGQPELKAESLFFFMRRAEIFTDLLLENKNLLKKVSFDGEWFSGLKMFDLILSAIGRKNAIQFTYQLYMKNSSRTVTLEPSLMKEYARRWYVVGFDIKNKKIDAFGIDRISDFVELESYPANTDRVAPEYFQTTIGVRVNNPPQETTITFLPEQKAYFLSDPWHEPYVITEDNHKEFAVKMNVSENYELEQRIYANIRFIQKIDPPEYAQMLKKRLQESINRL